MYKKYCVEIEVVKYAVCNKATFIRRIFLLDLTILQPIKTFHSLPMFI